MDFVIGLIAFIIMLSVIVILHELDIFSCKTFWCLL